MDKPYERKIYFGMAIDPIHVGTGGYTLGRVDNPTLRDFDGIPKIPGTSIEGVCRTFEYFQKLGSNKACAKGKKIREGNKEIQPCGNCHICFAHGFTRDDRSLQGMALFSDAKILFFPVASLIGPIWVTCPSKLKEQNVDQAAWQDFDESESCVISKHLESKLSGVGYLNFGWLLLQLKKKDGQVVTHNIKSETIFEVNGNRLKFKDRGFELEEIFRRLVIVSDSVFSQIVNSNLEVRTSVSIDPTTGAAEEGALFTYEAIPRTTIFYFDVVYQKPPEHFGLSLGLNDIISTVETGFELFEFLGVGGMGTRGFGKLRVLGLDKAYDEIELSKIHAQNLVNEIKELEEKLKESKPEEKDEIEGRVKELKGKAKQIYEKMKRINSVWENAIKEVER